jgi:predicted nucleic acid-binding protein
VTYLVDTNVRSELRKGTRAHPEVRTLFADIPEEEIFLAAVTVGEIRRGIERVRRRGDAPQAEHIEAWLEDVLSRYADRVLHFDLDCAQLWGHLMAWNAHNPVDKQIVATAFVFDLTIVTRNVRDFEGSGVRLLNPWQ